MLRVNARVELEVPGSPETLRYRTRVEDVRGGEFRVALPTTGGEAAPLRAGDPVRGRVWAGHIVYAFDTVVLGRDGGTPAVLRLKVPAHFERLQRRGFVRIDARLPARYVPVVPVAAGDSHPASRKTRTVDISGGGVALYLAEPVEAGTLLDVFIDLPGVLVSATAEVVRIIRTDAEGHLAGLRFVDIRERERDAIVRYIFEEQRQRRRRGLL